MCVRMHLTAERAGILVSAEEDMLDGEDDDDDLDASVETDEGIVTDDMAPTGEGEAVVDTDAEKVSSSFMSSSSSSSSSSSERQLEEDSP